MGLPYEKFKIKNSYSNTTERGYFAIKIRKCEIKIDKICKNDAEIEKLLEHL